MLKTASKRAIWIILAGVLLLALAILSSQSAPARAEAPRQQTTEYCLSCHNNPDLKMTLPSGEEVSLYISPDALHQSVHVAAGIECEACHTNITTYPHPQINFQTRRELSLSYYQACQKCHPANYAKTQDSMHAQAAKDGKLGAPICTDCHGAHSVTAPDQPRAKISETCGQCHQEILADYKKSIHGGALIQEDNPDVPVCTDCHGVHNIQDARTAQFRNNTPDLCANCHANQELMSKYKLSADVYNLYNLSWHGVDLSVYKARWPTSWHGSAVCTDCHGVHNMLPASDPNSAVNPANLLTTCQKCHPDAGPNWVGTWVGHNRIDQSRTPFLYYTQVFYQQFTPFILWLSLIYVALQLFHAIVERIRRSM